jgi:hypothetical protein
MLVESLGIHAIFSFMLLNRIRVYFWFVFGNFGAIVCETFKINGPFGGKCQTRSNEPWLSWWMGGLPLKESWVAIKTDSITVNHIKQPMTLAWPWLRYVSFPWLPWRSFFFQLNQPGPLVFSASASHQDIGMPQHGEVLKMLRAHDVSEYAKGMSLNTKHS